MSKPFKKILLKTFRILKRSVGHRKQLIMISKKVIKYCLMVLFGLVAVCVFMFEVSLSRQRQVLKMATTPTVQKDSLQTQRLDPVIRAQYSGTAVTNRTSPSVNVTVGGSSQGLTHVKEIQAGNSVSLLQQENGEVLVLAVRNATMSSPVVNRNASLFLTTPPQGGQIVFESKAQVALNGTRPVACDKCFNTEFPVLVENKDVCMTENEMDTIDVIMLVLTTHRAIERRQAIRDTWASVTNGNTGSIRHAFLLGRSKVDDLMRSVEKEHAMYGDIVMHDFVDSYSNLTLKTMSGLRWAVRICGHARFFLKADDDMWINIPSLLNTLNREEAALQTAVGGSCSQSARPIRNRNSKWFASVKAYPQSTYPGFCSGTAYVSSLNVARHVISVSPNVPFFYLEDVYLALCIQRLGGRFTLKRLPGFFRGGGHPCVLKSDETITVHQVSPSRLRQIWMSDCSKHVMAGRLTREGANH